VEVRQSNRNLARPVRIGKANWRWTVLIRG